MSPIERRASIDELLDRAIAAINRGDRPAATALAARVLAVDSANAEAEDLLAAPSHPGEIRRLTIFFADLVDSTALSTQVEPETYRLLVGRYRDQVLRIVDRYEGHIGSTKGDGLLAVFGHPMAHEDDARRAVKAGLEITRQVARLSDQAKSRFGIEINVRVGVHRGFVYLDTTQDDVYGLAANLAARVSGLAPPGAVVVSDSVEALVRNDFELQARPAAPVKGVDGLIAHYQVVGENAPAVRAGRSPLIGRDHELAHIHQSWARAKAGTLSTPGVVLRGEPGIGKSRLAAAAAELVEATGSVVLELAGSSFHADAGLHPIRTLLEHRCGISRLTDEGERLRLLEGEVEARGLDPVTAIPLLAPVLGIGTAAGYQPMAAEGRKLYELISDAVQRYLLACLGNAPGLLVAEDVHWFDPSTMEVLHSLLHAAGGRLLVVMTGRPGDWLPPDWPVTVFDLTALTDELTDALISTLDPGLSADTRAVVAGRCDGVPFYIEQVVGGLTETGVPEALYEPLFARLRASGNVVPVVEAAALIGRHLDRNLLCSVVDLSDDVVDEVIGQLEDALVLEPWGAHSWRFRHELLREVAAELAPPSVRRSLHGRVADALTGGGDPDWRLVAAHYEQAERFDEAVSAYQRASDDARRRGALGEARSYLTNALIQIDEQAPGLARDRREMALSLERGFLTSAAEGPSSHAVTVDFERCLRLGGADVRDDEAFATLLALAGYYFAVGDLRRAANVFEPLRGGLIDGRESFRPVIEACVGILAWLRGEFAIARPQIEKATADFGAAGRQAIDAVWFAPADPITMAHGILAVDRLACGDLPGAEAQLAQAARQADQLRFPQGPFSLAFAHFFEIWIRIEAHQLDRAAALATELIDHAERYGFEVWALWGAAQQATVNALGSIGADGTDPNVLSAHVARATTLVDAVHAAELTIYITLFDGALGRLLTAAGQPDQARAHLNTALALARDAEMHFYDAELLRLRAHTYSDPDARQAGFAAALELAGHQGAPLFELRAALDDFELRGGTARAALTGAVGRIPATSTWPELARARLVLSEPPHESEADPVATCLARRSLKE